MPNTLLASIQLGSLQQLGFAGLSRIIVALCINVFQASVNQTRIFVHKLLIAGCSDENLQCHCLGSSVCLSFG